jgi:hypothetical protein
MPAERDTLELERLSKPAAERSLRNKQDKQPS